jgi:hypothetical protein
MDARTKALKSHRKRLRDSGLKRVEVSVRAEHVELLRDVAARLREKTADPKRIQSAISPKPAGKRRSLVDALYDPAVAGSEFDDVFDELERLRRDPETQRTRDVDL